MCQKELCGCEYVIRVYAVDIYIVDIHINKYICN